MLYSVVEDAQRYKDYLEENAQGLYDHELAEFLIELRDETSRRASEPRVCLPSGWPTAEFSSVLTRKTSPTSETPFYDVR